MIYAVKFWSEAPENEEWKIEGVPETWPWRSQQIPNEQQQLFEDLGWTIFTEQGFQDYLAANQESFDVWWNNRQSQINETRLKVLDLVQEEFVNYHPSKIDFTIHLKPNIVLNKKVTMLRNGRPEKAEYFLGADKICEIKFEFTVNQFNFITQRTEKLAYVMGNGSLSDYYTIKSKIYDMTNFADKAEVTEERVDARVYIMKEIKSVLNDVLGLYYIVLPPVEQKKTPEELWQLAGTFWSAYSTDIDSWYNTATGDFKAKILADNSFDFLELVVPPQISQEASPKTVRNYIADRITY
jgi:hypothetical protein